MNYSSIDVKPFDVDWSEGWGETWETVIPDFLAMSPDDLLSWIDGEGAETDDYDRDDHDEMADLAEEHWNETPDEGMPMMNYAYPADIDNGEWAQGLLRDLPVVVVWLNGEYVLALSGGGMDLSWEICEAYMKLGQYPPAHFCDLPAMSGRGESAEDIEIIRACETTLVAMVERADSQLNSLRRKYPKVAT